jgi:hypothetical protein
MNTEIGDTIWIYIKGAPSNYGYGKVVSKFKDKCGNTYLEFFCLVNGGLRAGLETNIIKKPGARMIAKVAAEQRAINLVLREKR